MQTKKLAEEYVKVLTGHGNKTEKRKIITRAIMEEQIKFLNTVKDKWGENFYFEIVGKC